MAHATKARWRSLLIARSAATTGLERATTGFFPYGSPGTGSRWPTLVSVAYGDQHVLDLLTQYIDHALTFERMAEAEPNQGLKADFERQASAHRRLAAQRARRLGLPLPSEPERHIAGDGRRDN